MASKHAVIRTDKMTGTNVDTQLYNVKFYADDEAAEVENGNIVMIGDLDPDNRDVHIATAPTSGVDVGDLAVTAGVCLFYDESVRHYEDEWINEADRAFRSYGLHNGCMFSVTAEAFSGTPEVGKYVGYTAGSTKIAIAEEASATTFGKIIDSDISGRYEYFCIRISTNATV